MVQKAKKRVKEKKKTVAVASELDDSDCEIVGDGKPYVGEIS